jgi:AbrB family looped-hinge helix DNA binding protein
MATVTRKGQITLPKNVRDALGLIPGCQVEFELEPGRAILRKHVAPEVFERWQGQLRGKLLTGSVDEFMELLRGERPPVEGGSREGGRG